MNKKYIVVAHQAKTHPDVGGKARSLAALADFGVPIPPWFVITPNAFYDSLSEDQQKAFEGVRDLQDATAFLNALSKIVPSEDVAQELKETLSMFGAGSDPGEQMVAVRSSASEEDGTEQSYAGQLESYLCIPPEEVMDHVVKVWQSAFNERVLAYRMQHGQSDLPPAPAVLIQQMVFPESAGVAFGADPVSGKRDTVVIGAVYGLGSTLVSGEVESDTFRIDENGTVFEQTIAEKQEALVYLPDDPQRLVTVNVKEDLVKQPALDDLQIQQINLMVRKLGQFMGRPQDVEWAVRKGQIYLLQARPLTALENLADPDGQVLQWDNRSLLDSFSGVTMPMSFCFGQRFYAGYYRQLFDFLSENRQPPMLRLNDKDASFERTLGLIRGRVYGNMTVLGYISNLMPEVYTFKEYTNKVAVVYSHEKHETSSEHVSVSQRSVRERFRVQQKLFVRFLRLPAQVKRFREHLDKVLMRSNYVVRDSLTRLRADQLTNYYRHMEYELTVNWDVPVINDHITDILYGALATLCQTWCGDEHGTLQNDLLSGTGGVVSAEPLEMVQQMAQLVSGDSNLVDAFCDDEIVVVFQRLQGREDFFALYQQYMDRFGDRCLEDLKLENEPLFSDPEVLIRNIGQLAREAGHSTDASQGTAEKISLDDVRAAAELHVNEALGSNVIRKAVFYWVLNATRARVQDRENLRYDLTRALGRIRLIVTELGKRLMAANQLDNWRDVFYLTPDEMLGAIDGTAVTQDLKALVTLRRSEFDQFSDLQDPEPVFETRGAVYQGNDYKGETGEVSLLEEHLKGQGCCSGIARGPVKIVDDPSKAALSHGEILVAKRSDPGWVMLFPAAHGAVFETGSPLCHAAIVAREMGLPAIVSVAGVTRWLKDGDWVEVNGRTGVIRKIDKYSNRVRD